MARRGTRQDRVCCLLPGICGRARGDEAEVVKHKSKESGFSAVGNKVENGAASVLVNCQCGTA